MKKLIYIKSGCSGITIEHQLDIGLVEKIQGDRDPPDTQGGYSMGVLLDAVELIQKKIEKENNITWKEIIEEVKEDLESNKIFIKNDFK